MKHTKLWTLVCILLSVLLTSFYLQPERKVLRFYQKHSEELKRIVDDSYDETQLPSFLEDVRIKRWPGEYDIVRFDLVLQGITPASKYYGLFYSKDDVPVSYENGNEKLTAVSENEWTWKGTGDNQGYIKKIEPCWYYYEASF
jgi:hypothetical protein